jgi:hypothetical protein
MHREITASRVVAAWILTDIHKSAVFLRLRDQLGVTADHMLQADVARDIAARLSAMAELIATNAQTRQ